jgi:hypothetical protein
MPSVQIEDRPYTQESMTTSLSPSTIKLQVIEDRSAAIFAVPSFYPAFPG